MIASQGIVPQLSLTLNTFKTFFKGPTEETLQDFWRMIWEQEVEYVVMLTNSEEKGKVSWRNA